MQSREWCWQKGEKEYEGRTCTSQRQNQEVTQRPDSRNILDDEMKELPYSEYGELGTK